MCRPKEPFFFCYDHVYARGWPWYESLFAKAEGRTAVGEGTTVYAQTGTYPNTVPRIAKHLPDARLIYITRHPLERLESMWIELLSQGLTTLPFHEALRSDPQYIDSALYWKQLSAYREHFPDERLLLLFFDDFKTNPDQVLEQCFHFLGVDASVRIPNASLPRYASAGKRRDRAVTNMLRRHVPFFHELRDVAPSWLRRSVAGVLKEEIVGRPSWPPETRRWIINQIAEDLKSFLRFAGRSEEHWSLDSGIA